MWLATVGASQTGSLLDIAGERESNLGIIEDRLLNCEVDHQIIR
jgi:hypothetical protein